MTLAYQQNSTAREGAGSLGLALHTRFTLTANARHFEDIPSPYPAPPVQVQAILATEGTMTTCVVLWVPRRNRLGSVGRSRACQGVRESVGSVDDGLRMKLQLRSGEPRHGSRNADRTQESPVQAENRRSNTSHLSLPLTYRDEITTATNLLIGSTWFTRERQDDAPRGAQIQRQPEADPNMMPHCLWPLHSRDAGSNVTFAHVEGRTFLRDLS